MGVATRYYSSSLKQTQSESLIRVVFSANQFPNRVQGLRSATQPPNFDRPAFPNLGLLSLSAWWHQAPQLSLQHGLPVLFAATGAWLLSITRGIALLALCITTDQVMNRISKLFSIQVFIDPHPHRSRSRSQSPDKKNWCSSTIQLLKIGELKLLVNAFRQE